MRTVLPGVSRREAEAFAALLERDRVPAGSDLAPLVALTRALSPAAITPAPGFRTALRERLVAEAAARPVVVPAPRPPGDTAPDRTRPSLRHVVATVALASVVTGAGAAAASTRALPGDVLYGLKRQVEAVQLALALTDLERGRELLDQADARLGEAERLAAAGTEGDPADRAALASVLADWDVATASGVATLTRDYRETGSEEPMRVLDRFVTESQERLEDLLVILDPSLRGQVRNALETLDALGSRVSAVLPASASRAAVDRATAAGAGAGTGTAGDGWAVSRAVERTVAGAAGSLDGGASGVAPGTLAGGSEGTASTGSGSTAPTLGDALDASASGGDAASDGTGTSAALGGGLVGGSASASTSTSAPLPAATVPTAEPAVPGVGDPLPPVTTPTVTVPAPTPTLPLGGGPTCVPLPPLTTC